LNNNRGNNRRRGRGNVRPQSGGPQVNRIDSRARGNAPQLLEKYRKLAQDAHLNGDRVQAEYYLQFADHYFRVIADTRVRQEEARLRRDDRWQDNPDGDRDVTDDSGDFDVSGDFPAFDAMPVYQRRDREDRPERPERSAEERPANDRPNGDRANNDRSGNDRQGNERAERNPRGRDQNGGQTGYAPGNAAGEPTEGRRRSRPEREEAVAPAPVPAPVVEAPAGNGDVDSANPYEPPENPFLRETRGTRGLRPRREDRRPRRDADEAVAPVETAAAGEGSDSGSDSDGPPVGLDPALLPPAISVSRDAEEAPAPRRRTRRKAAPDDAGEPMQSVG
jgi:hypothetical protein